MELAQRRRRDWLNPIWGLLVILLILNVASILFLLPFGISVGEVGTVDLRFSEAFTHQPLPKFDAFPMLDLRQASVIEQHPSLTQDVLYVLGHEGPLSRLVSAAMLIMALNLIADARGSDPFRPAMVRRLRRLGLMVLVLGLFGEIVEHAARVVLLNIALPDSQLLDSDVNRYPSLWWLVPGLVLLGVSEVFQRGCDLRDELDGVV